MVEAGASGWICSMRRFHWPMHGRCTFSSHHPALQTFLPFWEWGQNPGFQGDVCDWDYELTDSKLPWKIQTFMGAVIAIMF